MLGELKDKDFYCSGFSTDICGHFPVCLENCRMRHRKHPTPEQFKEEYGEEYPDAGAVYFWDNHPSGWWINDKENALANTKDHLRYGRQSYTVCACTPFGSPDKDWRPL